MRQCSLSTSSICARPSNNLRIPLSSAEPTSFYGRISRRTSRSGTLTLERAAELLECAIGFWGSHTFVANADFRENHQVNYMLNSINVGGVDKEGKDASNLLSYMLLQAVGLLQLSAPSVALQWHSGTPRWLMDKAISTNIKTKGGLPMFENGDHVVARYSDDGTPVEKARDWY